MTSGVALLFAIVLATATVAIICLRRICRRRRKTGAVRPNSDSLRQSLLSAKGSVPDRGIPFPSENVSAAKEQICQPAEDSSDLLAGEEALTHTVDLADREECEDGAATQMDTAIHEEDKSETVASTDTSAVGNGDVAEKVVTSSESPSLFDEIARLDKSRGTAGLADQSAPSDSETSTESGIAEEELPLDQRRVMETTDQEECPSNAAPEEAVGEVQESISEHTQGTQRSTDQATRDAHRPVRGVSGSCDDGTDAREPRDEQERTPQRQDDDTQQEGPRDSRGPQQYRGLARRPAHRQDVGQRSTRGEEGDSRARSRSLPIEVRLLFDRGGSCTISLIAKRSSGMPEDVTVTAQGQSLDLRAMHEEWYQDIFPGDLARILREGAVWNCDGSQESYRWSLSGRELFVLAARTDLRGYVSQPCLEIGREHVVLCSEQIRQAAQEAIRATGAEPSAVLSAADGTPAGWVVFQSVVPTRSVCPSEEADILNALRPLPRIDISFQGGIRLEYTTWLEGFPPAIRLYGGAEHTPEVLIDGHCATRGEDGAYRVSGWDSAGAHTVWCGGISKTYSIVPFAASWEPWDAYSFPVACGSTRRLSICGPLVRETAADAQDWSSSLLVPPSNPLILGASPGEYIVATRVSGVVGSSCIASPFFSAVWALPRYPLRCDKKTVRIIFLGNAAPPKARRPKRTTGKRSNDDCIDAWCRMILDASRKGLRLVPDSEKVQNLWFCYKRLARSIWRERR